MVFQIKNSIRTPGTILLIVIVIGIILYPKIKPMFKTDSGSKIGSPAGAKGMRGGG